MSKRVTLVVRLAVVLMAAALCGVAIAFASALIGHEILVGVYGENLAPIDDTLPMNLTVWLSYLAGGVAALAVMVLGWRYARR